MKFLFVAPRFHTNQFPIVKSLIRIGHEVEFFVQNIGESEDHSVIVPYIMEKSHLSSLLRMLFKKNKSFLSENMDRMFFIPSIRNLYKKIREYHPDIVILRNRSMTSMFVYIICRLLSIKCIILYNQTPLYNFIDNSSKNGVKKITKNIMCNFCFPNVRITPVYSSDISRLREGKADYFVNNHEYFVPFIGEISKEVQSRKYCRGGKINILDVGKYRDYKNHFLLVDAISLIKNKKDLNVTIIGEVSKDDEKKYYYSLMEYIKKKNLIDIINLEKNIEYSEMKQVYLNNDVFVLTSKMEVASIAVIEAMANGLVTISTDANGTASYIKEGECGYLFKTMDAKDLALKIEQIISNKNKIRKFGMNAYNNINNNYTFEQYYIELNKVLIKEFGVNISK